MRKFKFMSLLAAAALLAGFTGCSDDTGINGNDNNGEKVLANTQVRITVENGSGNNGSRAAKTNDETGDGNETGIPDEYLVNNATLYFFNANTGMFAEAVSFRGFVKDETVTDNKVVWKSQNRQLAVGSYNVVVLVNGTAATAPTTDTSLDEFMKDVKSDAETWITDASTGLLMASRNAANAYAGSIEVTEANTTKNPAVVNTNVERTVAKIMLHDAQETPANYAYDVTGMKKYDRITSVDATVSIQLSDYRMQNLRNEYFTFRHNTTGFTPVNPGVTTDNVTYGFGDITQISDYIMDPKTFMKYVSMPVDNSVNVDYRTWYTSNDFYTVGDADDHILGYCQENTMEKDAQKKGYGTAVIFKGKIAVEGITIAEGENLYYDKSNNTFYGSYTELKNALSLKDDVDYKELVENNIAAYKDGQCTYVYYIKHADNGEDTKMGIMEFATVRNNVYKVGIQGISAPGNGLLPDPDDSTKPIDPADPSDVTKPDPSIDPAEDIETEDITVALKVKLTVMPWIIRNNDVILH